MQHRSRADANHDIMGFVMRSLEEVNVISRDERKAQLFRQDVEPRVDQLLRLDAVIWQFKKEMIVPKNIGKFCSGSFSFLEAAALNRDVTVSFQTCAHPNQPSAMLGQTFIVDSRL